MQVIETTELALRTLQADDEAHFRQAWDWMQLRPDLYGENEGFADFADFIAPPQELKYFGLFEDGQLIAVASLRLEAKKSCRFGLIAPENPRFRSIASLLKELQRIFFDQFEGEALWVALPPESHEVAQKLVGWFGWKPAGQGLFTFTVFDYLKAKDEQQKDSASASRATAD